MSLKPDSIVDSPYSGLYAKLAEGASRPCIHPWFVAWINAAGDATCCPQNRIRLGNIGKIPLFEIWNGDLIRDVRKAIAQGEYRLAGCEPECPYLCNSFKTPESYPPLAELITHFDFEMADDDSAYAENFKKVWQAYLTGSTQVDGFPLLIDIQATVRCNADCFMCGQPHVASLGLSKDLLDQLKPLRTYANFFRFQGGEVFTLDWFEEYLDSLDSPDYPHFLRYVITNGSLLRKTNLEKLTRGDRPVRFLVSLDGVRSETYSHVRRTLRFDRVMTTLQDLSTIQSKQGTRQLVRWNYVVMKCNLHEMKPAIDLAETLGVELNFAALQGKFPEENIFLYPDIVPFDLLPFLDDLQRYAAGKSVDIAGFDGMRRRIEAVYCGIG